jgi:nitrite reductase/ring-hydroxylating ferredoxin subunit
MTETDPTPSTPLDRRTVLRGAAVGGAALPLLASCGGGTSSSGDSGGDSGGESGGGSGSSGQGSGGGGGKLATSDVPVGGGKILTGQQVVVTQPKKGDFKAFTAVCTHQGCLVTQVTGGSIVCPCHGSKFSIEDGSPQAGPAQSALASKKVTVEGDQISVS